MIEFLNELIDGEKVKTILVSLPGVFLGLFSLFFAIQKIGSKVLITYSVGMNQLNEERIDNLTLINKKNKPVIVFSIQVVIDDHLVVEVEKFEPPLILKPLESVHIETTPVSHYYIGSEKWEADLSLRKKQDVYLITESNKIKCKVISSPSINKLRFFNDYVPVAISNTKYNGIVYSSDKVRYAIVYYYDSKQHTAFVSRSGFILGDWEFRYNAIPPDELHSVDSIKNWIINTGFNKLFSNFAVDDLSDKR